MSVAMDEWPRRHRITVEEYYRMAEVGLLAPDARVELIEGEIIDMPPIGSRHGASVDLLAQRLILALRERAIVRVQGPVRLDNFSEPQPDLAVLTPRDDFYRQGHPSPKDTLLMIEVSDTTLRYDRHRKLPLYARHGIPELWIVDTNAKQLNIFRGPSGSTYIEAVTLGAPSIVSITSLPDVAIDLSALLG